MARRVFVVKGQRHRNRRWVRVFYWHFRTRRHANFAVIDFWPLLFGVHGVYETVKVVPTIAFKLRMRL